MNSAAKSVFVWGIYMLVVGVLFLLDPNVFLQVMGFAPTTEVWVRMVAMFAVALGYFYIQTARHNMIPFFRWKVQMHVFGIICMVAFVVLNLAPPMLLLFAAADAVGGLWTALALRSEGAAVTARSLQ